MTIKAQLGLKIKRLRLKHGYTQEQFAEKMQIATRTLCGIENGENFVKSDTLEKFCDIFNITYFELFAVDHIKPKEDLIDEIINDIKSFHSQEKLETLYKIVKALKLE